MWFQAVAVFAVIGAAALLLLLADMVYRVVQAIREYWIDWSNDEYR